MAVPLLIATVAMGVFSSISSASAQASQAKSEAAADQYNASVARQNADNANQAWSANEDAKRRENSEKLGAQRAALTESGMDITSGSGADLVKQSDINAEMDALNIRYQGQLQAKGYNDQAALDDYQASAAKKRASQAWINGGLKAGSSVLSGASMYYGSGRYGNGGLTGNGSANNISGND